MVRFSRDCDSVTADADSFFDLGVKGGGVPIHRAAPGSMEARATLLSWAKDDVGTQRGQALDPARLSQSVPSRVRPAVGPHAKTSRAAWV